MSEKKGTQIIFIDPSCDILYSSFYIYGLQKLFGKKSVKFSSKYFKDFSHNNHFFAFVAQNASSTKKIIVDFTDSSVIDKIALEWCDVYGKINLEEEQDLNSKIIPIGPSFGIQIYNPVETVFHTISNYLKAFRRIPDKKRFFSDYKRQFSRPRLLDYQSHEPKKDYIFFLSSLWKKEERTNHYRANFIKACKSNNDIIFEGGFAPRSKNDMQGFEELTVNKRIPMESYLKHTKESLIVFNTPAVKSCHGWKLAEFLCLGKAIISTQLSRALAASIIDNVHYILTDGSLADLNQKIESLAKDSGLRMALETNARNYYLTNLQPVSVIKRLVGI